MIERGLLLQKVSFPARLINITQTIHRQSTSEFWSDRSSDRFSSNLKTGRCLRPLTGSSKFG
jgi:hypothetical protein